MKPGVSRQDGVRIDRIIAKLKKGGPGEETVQLRERVEKLEEKLRKLDTKLQDLEARDAAE